MAWTERTAVALAVMAFLAGGLLGSLFARRARRQLVRKWYDAGYDTGWDEAHEAVLPAADETIVLAAQPRMDELSPQALSAEETEDFYEEDEDPREVWAKFSAGPHGVTASPYAGSLTPAQRRRDKHKRRGEYAPEPGDDTLTHMFAEFGTWEQQLAAIGAEGQTPWLTAQLQEAA